MMTDREQYAPAPARGAEVRKDGEKWTLILVRELRHSPEKVWQVLTDLAHLRERGVFNVDGSLGTVGTVKLTTVGESAAHDHLDGRMRTCLSGSPTCGVSMAEKKAAKTAKTANPAAKKAAAWADKADGEAAELAKIAAMPAPYRAMGECLQALILRSALALQPAAWYGVPGYAKDRKSVWFFRADKNTWRSPRTRTSPARRAL